MMDLSAEIGACIAMCGECVTVVRPLQASYVNGVLEDEITEETFESTASFQPLTDQEMQRLPEGLRREGTQAVFSVDRYRTANPASGHEPDRLRRPNGDEYEVQLVQDWEVPGSYSRYVVARYSA